MTVTQHTFPVRDKGDVSAILEAPESARALLVLAHGAGAGMHHAFMSELAQKLVAQGIAVFRYQFPYMEKGSRRPDGRKVLLASVENAVNHAQQCLPDLPLFAGGKSMGGRMSSGAASEGQLPNVRGLIFFGFPLHPAGKPGIERADHLDNVNQPMLFLQGTRDALADLDLLTPVCERLGSRATLHICDGADHSFKVLKRSGRTPEGVMEELVRTTVGWIDGQIDPA